jgi:hypothetical protein
MSRIRDVKASNEVPDDIVLQLGNEGIEIIIQTLWVAFSDLKKARIIRDDFTEDAITQEWAIRVSNRWYNDNRASRVRINLTPVNQYSDDTMATNRRKSPTIDFCFRAWKLEDGYFGAECKNLYSEKMEKKKRYVEKGVKHFISGYYASKSTVSAMVGYVLSGDIPQTAHALEKLILETKPILGLTRDLKSVEPQFKSQHERISDGKVILLYHLFFDFFN